MIEKNGCVCVETEELIHILRSRNGKDIEADLCLGGILWSTHILRYVDGQVQDMVITDDDGYNLPENEWLTLRQGRWWKI